jgi:hypothetical protein
MKVYVRYLMILSVICSSMLFAGVEEFRRFTMEHASVQDLIPQIKYEIEQERGKGTMADRIKQSGLQDVLRDSQAKVQNLKERIELEEMEMQEELLMSDSEIESVRRAALEEFALQKQQRQAQKEAQEAIREQEAISSALGRGFGGAPDLTREEELELLEEFNPEPVAAEAPRAPVSTVRVPPAAPLKPAIRARKPLTARERLEAKKQERAMAKKLERIKKAKAIGLAITKLNQAIISLQKEIRMEHAKLITLQKRSSDIELIKKKRKEMKSIVTQKTRLIRGYERKRDLLNKQLQRMSAS